MGRQAQRSLIVAALKAGIDVNVQVREEQRQFNLIATPQYPELIPNMVALNNERNNTAFVIGDTPLRLAPDSTSVVEWATNTVDRVQQQTMVLVLATLIWVCSIQVVKPQTCQDHQWYNHQVT